MVLRPGFSLLAIAVLAGCASGGGGAAENPASAGTSRTTAAAPITTTQTGTTRSEPAPDFTPPPYGVEPTITRALQPGEVTCPPPDGPTVTVQGPAPGAPTLTVAVPAGFTEAAPSAAEVRLAGPDGMTATVTITPTTRDAAAAFVQYADDRVAGAAFHSISVLPGDLCGYSGQKLIGVLAEQAGTGQGKRATYADRIVHIWANHGDFLAAVQLESPNGTPGFDAARSAMLAELGIAMPS
ncbi:hypothetical protein [Mycolicibacterium frederiksbergense]|nr:hypothetical protein [Mycolicibacterium frederiksbergense]